MLRSLMSLRDNSLKATDGDIGAVRDFYFDDGMWKVRYIVVDSGRWLPGRKVLVSPQEVIGPPVEGTAIPVNLTMERIRNSPGLDSDRPVSRQDEYKLSEHFRWDIYWGDSDPSLRSFLEMRGYSISSVTGSIGTVADLIADVDDWMVRYFVVDTGHVLPDRAVLLPVEWIESIRWRDKDVVVNVSVGQVKAAPPYDSHQPVNREYEERIYDYYGRPRYWEA